jgi:2-dehydropantoate 2-reductase
MNPGTSRRHAVLVVGCGGMGAIFAAKLAAVAEVTGYDTDGAHVEVIARDGLRVGGVSSHLVQLEATTDPARLAGREFDAVLLLVKSAQTGAAVRALRPFVGADALWVTLQNGMGNVEEMLGIDGLRVARGVTMDAGSYVGPGQVEHLVHGQDTWIGPVNVAPGACDWLAELLTDAGLPARAVADPMSAVWSKFVFNCVMNPVGALLLGVNAARYEVAEVRELIDEMAAECIGVVRALGGSFAFDPMAFVGRVRRGEASMSKHCGSMALDIRRGAPTEIEQLTGYIVREAARLGIEVPACRTVYRLVKGLERARALQSGA